MWSVHMQAGLIDCIRNVRPRQRQVLEGAGDAAVEGSIIDRMTISG
jgi:hypothetical protein